MLMPVHMHIKMHACVHAPLGVELERRRRRVWGIKVIVGRDKTSSTNRSSVVTDSSSTFLGEWTGFYVVYNILNM